MSRMYTVRIWKDGKVIGIVFTPDYKQTITHDDVSCYHTVGSNTKRAAERRAMAQHRRQCSNRSEVGK